MPILTAEQLTKTYGDKLLFQNINFAIDEHEKIGLIGINGTGKSSLLKILSGKDEQDSGVLSHANHFRIEYLPQQPIFNVDRTVLEQVFTGDAPVLQLAYEYESVCAKLESEPSSESLNRRLVALQEKMDASNAWDVTTQAKTVLTKLGIDYFSKRLSELSGGQKKRVAIARALIQPCDLLIMDEPTNHLDFAAIEWLEEYLTTFKGAILVVTHDRYFLNRVTNCIYELDNGNLFRYEGNYEYYLEHKALRVQSEEKSFEKKENWLRRELAWLKRGAKARTTKQKARIQRAEELRDQTVRKKEEDLQFSLLSSRLGKKVIEIDQVVKGYENQTLIRDFTFIVQNGARIGIVGDNGKGKSTLLKLMNGKLMPDQGTVVIGPTVKFAYFSQEQEDLDESKRLIEYIKETAEVIHTSDGKRISAAQMLERFLFPSHTHGTFISRLSGGEKKRLYLLKILMSQPNVLLLDEPTNDLDVITLAKLEEYLDDFDGTVIIVSHDRYFLDRTCNQLLTFEENGKIESFIGQYSDYLLQKQRERTITETKEPKVKKESKPKKSSRTLSYKEKLEWERLEENIPELEEFIKNVNEEINGAGADIEKVQRLYKKQKEAEDELNEALEKWMELAEKVDR